MYLSTLSRATRRLLLCAALLGTGAAGADAALERGQRIYRQGLQTDGLPLQACEDCHRRSGLGSSEGRVLIPAINGLTLDNPTGTLDPRMSQTRQRRPAYDLASFARSLREGRDPADRELHPVMPRYPLADADIEALYAYLQRLSIRTSPGVDARNMYLATIVTDGADPQQRDAVHDVLQAFTEARNRETRLETRRHDEAPFQREYRYRAFRRWQLREWRLSGPASGWPAQLDALWRQQPVFAVLGGVGSGEWAPVHDFCEQRRIACLFPLTETPPERADSFYNLYLSRGMPLEAEVVASALGENAEGAVIQLHDGSREGRAAAERLTAQADRLGLRLGTQAGTDCPQDHTGALVIWGGRALADRCAAASPQATLYLSERHSGRAALLDAAPDYAERLRIVSRRALPKQRRAAELRVRRWLQAQGIPERDRDTEIDAYYTVTLFADAQRHIWQNFYPEYLIERLEHMVDNSLLQPSAARVSLAQGQRFISKGAYLGSYADWAAGSPALRWITP